MKEPLDIIGMIFEANDLILDMQDHEGCEGFSVSTHKKLKRWCNLYTRLTGGEAQ